MVMGIVIATPNSFSGDGGTGQGLDARHAKIDLAEAREAHLTVST